MISYLNLPEFDHSTKQKLLQSIDDIYWSNFNPLSTEKFQKCYPFTSENFVGRSITGSLDEKLTSYLNEYIKDNSKLELIKKMRLGFGVILLKNLNDAEPAFFPPHTDYKRKLGINLILEKGGTDTCLEVYEPTNPPDFHDEIHGSSYWNHNNLTAIDKKNIKENVWHSFQASAPHSVTNILTRRTTLMMKLPFDSYEFFLARKEFFVV